MKKKRADWNIIKAVKDHLDIPVLANGDIRHLADAKKCLEYTGCDGVLSAETLLTNPALFSEEKSELGVPDCPEEPCLMLLEYLDLCEKYPTPQRMVRAHVHKLLGSWFSVSSFGKLRFDVSFTGWFTVSNQLPWSGDYWEQALSTGFNLSEYEIFEPLKSFVVDGVEVQGTENAH